MKLLYITVPSYFDLEVSLLKELGKLCELQILMYMAPVMSKSSAVSIEHIEGNCDLIRMDRYKEFGKYSNIVDLKKWTIINNPDGSTYNYFRLLRKTKKFIQNFSPDCIHSTTLCKGFLPLVPWLGKNFKNIHTIHDAIPHSKNFINDTISRMSYKYFKNFLFLSQLSKDADILKYKDKYGLNFYYSKLGVYDFLNSYEIGDNKYGNYFLFFGRIDYYKGVDILIRSFKKFNKVNDNTYRLIVAGKGEITEPIDSWDNIVLINRYIENGELANLIHHSICVVLPYRTMTQSGVLMSAFAMSKPVIVTNTGDVEALGVNGKYGIVIEPEDELALVNSMCDYKNENKSALFSRNIKQDYSDSGKNSWSNIAKELVNTYSKL